LFGGANAPLVVKPIGSFEWGVVLVGTGVVTTIVVLYAIGWEQPAVKVSAPVTVEVKAATIVAPAPTREVTRPVARQAPRATYVLTAVRGDSWLLARERSFHGRTLFEGLLPLGETLRLRSQRVWIRFGAASYINLAVDGRLRRLPSSGTFDAYVGPRRVWADRTDYATAAQSP
jgi:hypothetical protein